MQSLGHSVSGLPTRWGFIHIPKAAGSSIAATLESAAPGTVHVTTPYTLANFHQLVEGVPILSGHIPAFMFDWEEQRRSLFTVLRDPTERVLSNYRFILASPGHYAHAFFERFHPTLAECFTHPVLRIEISDFQTKMLGWRAQTNIIWPAHGRKKYGIFSSEYADFHYGSADAATLAAAKRRLLTNIGFACVARPESVLAICSRVVGTTLSTLKFENRTPSLPWKPTERDLEAVAAHNILDNALYNFALELLDKQQSY